MAEFHHILSKLALQGLHSANLCLQKIEIKLGAFIVYTSWIFTHYCFACIYFVKAKALQNRWSGLGSGFWNGIFFAQQIVGKKTIADLQFLAWWGDLHFGTQLGSNYKRYLKFICFFLKVIHSIP
jgi:hypothetical protein